MLSHQMIHHVQTRGAIVAFVPYHSTNIHKKDSGHVARKSYLCEDAYSRSQIWIFRSFLFDVGLAKSYGPTSLMTPIKSVKKEALLRYIGTNNSR